MIWLYATIAVGYLLTLRRTPYPRHWLVKAMPILILGVVALELDGTLRMWVLLAVGLSAVGDIALALENRDSRLFVLGLASFLLAHIAYVAAFSVLPGGWSGAAAVVLGTVAAVLLTSLWSGLGELRVPVLAYMIAIWAMVLAAWSRDPLNLTIAFGAASFMVSDALIAIDRFRQRLPWRDHLVMSTYYLAQGLIVFGSVS